MANTFMDLSTTSPGEKRDGSYWQSNRAKDNFEKVTPGSHPSPDDDRTNGPTWATQSDAQSDSGPSKSPQLEPTL